jgi:MoaD family protein
MAETLKTVRLLATLRSIAGAKDVTVPVAPEATARDLLRAIHQAYPMLGAYLLAPDGGLNPGIQFLVGGQHIEWQQGLDTPVANADDLLLIPPISGG